MSNDEKPKPASIERILDPRQQPFTYGRSRGNLPHLYKPAGTYFVTFCLDDAVPHHLRRRHALDRDAEPETVAESSEPPIEEGSRLLGRPKPAKVVEDALLHFHGRRYDLHAWVVMPNHVHVVVSPYDGVALSEITHSWKSFSATRINRMLGRSGTLWQAESFDHVVRNERSYEAFVVYVEANPVKAGLCRNPEDWPFSSARFRE